MKRFVFAVFIFMISINSNYGMQQGFIDRQELGLFGWLPLDVTIPLLKQCLIDVPKNGQKEAYKQLKPFLTTCKFFYRDTEFTKRLISMIAGHCSTNYIKVCLGMRTPVSKEYLRSHLWDPREMNNATKILLELIPNGSSTEMRMLLDGGCRLDEDGLKYSNCKDNPFLFAVERKSSPEQLQLLLDFKADVNSVDYKKENALMILAGSQYSAENNDARILAITRLLISRGISLTYTNTRQKNAAQVALEYGNLQMNKLIKLSQVEM